MPLLSLPSAQALGNIKANKMSRWPDGRVSNERLDRTAKVSLTPHFTIGREDKLLTIGSCFAREIERFLARLGFDVPAAALSIPREERNSETANDLLNKYSVHSMENELRWAFSDHPVPPDQFFLQAEDGKWVDPQLVPNLVPVELARAIERRRMVTDLFRRLPECRVVVITLGLGEAWFDGQTGFYLNGMPPRQALSAEPERFSLHVLRCDEIVESLERIHGLLTRHGHPDVHLLLTVSPVPFKATFTGEDAMTANCYSKSVQRSAAEEFVRRHGNVDYFPSYEIVTLSNRETAYCQDNIHVTEPMVAQIMNTVLAAYVPGFQAATADSLPPPLRQASGVPSLATLLSQAKGAMHERDYVRAIALYAAALGRFDHQMAADEQAMARLNLGIALLRAKQPEEGVRHLEIARSINQGDAETTYKLGLGYARLGLQEQALDMFEQAVRLDGAKPDHHWRLGLQMIRLNRGHEAALHLRNCLRLDPGHAAALEAAKLLPR